MNRNTTPPHSNNDGILSMAAGLLVLALVIFGTIVYTNM